MADKYYVPHGVSERHTAGGRPLEPGTFVTLTKEEIEANERLIKEGFLLKSKSGSSSSSAKKGE